MPFCDIVDSRRWNENSIAHYNYNRFRNITRLFGPPFAALELSCPILSGTNLAFTIFCFRCFFCPRPLFRPIGQAAGRRRHGNHSIQVTG